MIDELADFNGETVRLAIKEEIHQLESERNLLLEERNRLEVELAELEINPDVENRMEEISAIVRERLPIATFEGMRDLLELLEVKVVFYDLGEAIKLNVSCEIPGSEMDIVLMSS